MKFRFPALTLALLLALPPGALAHVVFRCHMTGRVMTTCCCPTAQHRDLHGPSLRKHCCDVQKAQAPVDRGAVSSPLGDLSPVPAPALFQPPPALRFVARAPAPRTLRPAGARAPPLPLHGRGVYLEVCSFLI
jgi:hypothetical protein